MATIILALLYISYAFHLVDTPCNIELKNATNYFLSDPAFSAFFSNSGKGVNDFGFYQDCIESNTSKYYMLAIQVTAAAPALNMGLCMPKQCNASDFNASKGAIADALSAIVKYPLTDQMVHFIDNRERNEEASAMNGYRWATIFILLGLLILSIIGAQFDQSQSTIGKILASFSIKKNAKALLFSENRVDQNLDALNGVRVLSMGWVILGHAFVMYFLVPTLNTQDLLHTLTTSTAFGTITGGTFSVDSFFCLSGFFACFSLTQLFSNQANRKASVIIIAIIKRLIRLYPIYIAIFLLSFNIMPLLGNGPIYYQNSSTLEACRKSWWYNILFIDNFQKSINMCFSWTWYIANDMQYFIVLIPICVVYCINKLAGMLSTLALILGSHIYTFVVAYVNSYPIYDSDFSKISDAFDKMYYPPWCRITAYLLGVQFGWLYLGSKNSKYSTKFTDYVNSLWKDSAALRYLLYIIGFALITFFTYSYTYFYTHEKVAEIWSVLYYTFSRTFYTIGLLLIIYPVTIGRSKPLLAFLGNPMFNFMAKITYAVYQVHLLIYISYLMSSQQGLEYQGLYIFTKAVEVFIASYFAGFVLTLLFESPVVQLEKFIFPPPKREIANDKAQAKHDEEIALTDIKTKSTLN